MSKIVELVEKLRKRAGLADRYIFTSSHAPRETLEETVQHVLNNIKTVYKLRSDASLEDVLNIVAGYRLYIYDLDLCRGVLNVYMIDDHGRLKHRRSFRLRLTYEPEVRKIIYMIVEPADRDKIPIILMNISKIITEDNIIEVKQEEDKIILTLRERPNRYDMNMLLEKLGSNVRRIRLYSIETEDYNINQIGK